MITDNVVIDAKMAADSRVSQQEKYFYYNSLTILLKAVEGERTTVDLRNESFVNGVVEHVDGYMNIVMKNCVFTDPRGDSFKYDMFFVHARNIRYVHIPPKIRIIPAIKEQLQQIREPKKMRHKKRTFKTKRAQERQREGLLAVHEILQSKEDEDAAASKISSE